VQFNKPIVAETPTTIAPLLDVVLLLLIFFMVTTSFAERQIPLELPSAESGSQLPSEPLIVNVDAEGRYSVEEEILTDEALAARFQALAREEGQLEIRADTTARHGAVVRLLDLAKQSRLGRVGIAVAPQ
jgi:biopolymer transport protein ExbD